MQQQQQQQQQQKQKNIYIQYNTIYLNNCVPFKHRHFVSSQDSLERWSRMGPLEATATGSSLQFLPVRHQQSLKFARSFSKQNEMEMMKWDEMRWNEMRWNKSGYLHFYTSAMKTGSPYLLSSPLGKSESSSQRETWTKMSANCHSYWLQLSESVKPHWCYAANSFIAFWCIGCVQSVFCHKKAQNAVRATRCHWLFQSSMAACSGRPDNKKGNGRSSAMQKQHHSWPGRMACGRRSQILGRICEDRCAPGTASSAKRIEDGKLICQCTLQKDLML